MRAESPLMNFVQEVRVYIRVSRLITCRISCMWVNHCSKNSQTHMVDKRSHRWLNMYLACM